MDCVGIGASCGMVKCFCMMRACVVGGFQSLWIAGDGKEMGYVVGSGVEANSIALAGSGIEG